MFRHALLTDAASLAVISMEVWTGTYLRRGVSAFFADYALAEFTREKFQAIITKPDERIIVSENDNGIDGFVRLSLNSTAPVEGCSSTEIRTLYVQPRHHGKGIGKGLLNESLKLCAAYESHSAWLTVNSENTYALAFYAAHDFQTVGQTYFRIADQTYPNEVLRRKIA